MPLPLPPTRPLRAPSLTALKTNSLFLLLLVLLRSPTVGTPFYPIWRRLLLLTLGLPREVANALETLIVGLLVYNIITAWRTLRRLGPVLSGQERAEALGKARSAPGTPVGTKVVGSPMYRGSPKVSTWRNTRV